MSDAIYTFNGKDITLNICIQIRAVVNELQKRLNISFYEKIGMTNPNDVMVYNHIEWTDFTVE